MCVCVYMFSRKRVVREVIRNKKYSPLTSLMKFHTDILNFIRLAMSWKDIKKLIGIGIQFHQQFLRRNDAHVLIFLYAFKGRH